MKPIPSGKNHTYTGAALNLARTIPDIGHKTNQSRLFCAESTCHCRLFIGGHWIIVYLSTITLILRLGACLLGVCCIK